MINIKMKVVAVFFVACIAIAVGSDVVIYDSTSQPKCTLVGPRTRRNDCRWHAGLDMADQIIEGGRIIAYKIQWFAGGWSDWFVPGLNDLDGKFNVDASPCTPPVKAKSLRRFWSYFYDHNHQFIICKPN
ncbi:uncharacterized protein LOC127862709 isoform X2 [Dreissena polymorpha]|uniref:uncharacterized protein LOC127862709 isoform X2 n=1 Tax=Dreissena polymorpha TaxID=45954 RepID=UPI00226504D2|nr:uncharacterized protein LOC127862709 isoform X2 [Dreissena polymorpha]